MTNHKETLSAKEKKKLAQVIWETGWTYIRHVVDTAREPFLILDDKLKVMAANEAFYRTFEVGEKEVEGHYVYDLGDGQWAGRHLRKLLEDILPNHTFFRDFEVDHNFPIIGQKIMLLNARRVYGGEGDKHNLIILAMEDVTKQRRIEERLQEYTKDLTRRIEQLEMMNKVMMERESKLIELTEELNSLKKNKNSQKGGN